MVYSWQDVSHKYSIVFPEFLGSEYPSFGLRGPFYGESGEMSPSIFGSLIGFGFWAPDGAFCFLFAIRAIFLRVFSWSDLTEWVVPSRCGYALFWLKWQKKRKKKNAENWLLHPQKHSSSLSYALFTCKATLKKTYFFFEKYRCCVRTSSNFVRS